MDSKVLESLMIPENNNLDIVNEGFMSNISNKLIALFRLIIKVINRFIIFIKSLFHRKRKNTDEMNKNISYIEKLLGPNPDADKIPDAIIKYCKENDTASLRYFLVNYHMVVSSSLYYKVFKYAEEKCKDLWQKHDGEEFPEDKNKWTKELYTNTIIKAYDNFSHERINFIRKIYPYIKQTKKKNFISVISEANSNISKLCSAFSNIISVNNIPDKTMDLIQEYVNNLSDTVNNLKENPNNYDISNNSDKLKSEIEKLEDSKAKIEHILDTLNNPAFTNKNGDPKKYNELLKLVSKTCKNIVELINYASKV